MDTLEVELNHKQWECVKDALSFLTDVIKVNPICKVRR